jgi:hypothetical protein
MNTDPWAWAADGRHPGFCLTFVRQRAPLDIVTILGADPNKAAMHTGAEAEAAHPITRPGSLLRCGTLGAWAYCYEDRAPVANRPAAVHRLSADTEVLQVTKGGDGMNLVEHVVDTRSIELFEPAKRTTVRGDGPHRLLALTEQLLANHPDLSRLVAALHVVGEQIGGTLDRNTLDGPLLTAVTTTVEPAAAPATPRTGRPSGLGRKL